jgi:dihydrofolate synthase/folylpolyglutamate synthase
MKTFEEVDQVLRQYWPAVLTRMPYTLDYITKLMEYLGNPQEKLKVIHVAGTSGKTSTAYYSAALLQVAGKKVGLAVSPHTYCINERVQIDMVPLPESLFCRELTEFIALVERSGIPITYFELLVAFAFWEFVRRGMEYAVIEVGMGGLLDGTNIVKSADKTCIITDIGLDHMTTLGNTLGEIAYQKAGIIQLRNSVVCYRQSDEIMQQIEDRSRQKQAELHILGPKNEQIELDLPSFQQRNMGLAFAAVNDALKRHSGESIGRAELAAAAKTYIPARMEQVVYKGKTVILDGAHNAQKLRALAVHMQRRYAGQSIAAVVSLAGGREYRLDSAITEMASFIDHAIVTPFGAKGEHHSSSDADTLLALLKKQGLASAEVVESPKAAIEALLRRPEQVLMVTGSLYLIGHVRRLLQE